MTGIKVEEVDMARRDDVSVKMDRQLASDLKIAAEFKGMSQAQYLTEIARPQIERDLEAFARATLERKKQRDKPQQAPPPKGGKG